jgi:hypothetical protein
MQVHLHDRFASARAGFDVCKFADANFCTTFH